MERLAHSVWTQRKLVDRGGHSRYKIAHSAWVFLIDPSLAKVTCPLAVVSRIFRTFGEGSGCSAWLTRGGAENGRGLFHRAADYFSLGLPQAPCFTNQTYSSPKYEK